MNGLLRAVLIGAVCWLLGAGRAAAQPDINPTGDPKLVPKRVLALNSGGHTSGVYKLMVNGYGDQLISVSFDKTIRIWDIQTGQPIRVLRPPVDRGALGAISAAALHPEGDLLAIGGYRALTPIYDHRIRLISLSSGQSVRLFKGHAYMVFDIAFSPDGKRMASGALDSLAIIWNVETGEAEHILKGHTNGVHGVAWSADGKHLATASLDGTARIWNTTTGVTEKELVGHQGPLNPIAWSPDGRSVATGCDDGGVRLFEPDGKPRYAWPRIGASVQSVCFSPDSSRLLFTYSGDGDNGLTGTRVLSMVDGREISRFTGHQNGVVSCTFLRDGKTAVTGDMLGDICLWDAASGRLVRRLQGKGRAQFAVGWNPDGQQVAWGGTNSFYDANQGLATLDQRTFSFSTLDFGPPPAGNYVRAQFALGPLQIDTTPPRVATVTRNGAVAASFTLPDPADRIRSWTLLNGNRAVLGGNRALYVYDVNSGQLTGELADDCDLVWCMSPSADFRYVLSGGADQTLRVWKPDTNELLASLFVAGDEWVAWSPDGYYAASLGGENLMGWLINNGLENMASFYPAARFHNSLYRPDIIRRLIKAGNLREAHTQADAVAAKVTKSVIVEAALPPQVKVVVNQAKQAGSSTVEIQATATPSGADPVTSLQLLVDGRPSRAPQLVAAAGVAGSGAGGAATAADGGKPAAQQHSWKIDLPPGDHHLTVRADTDKSYGLSDDAAIDKSAGAATPGNLYVLAIGVSAAQDPTLRLPLAAADATAVAEALQKSGQPMFTKVETKVLTDAQATRTGILQGLAWLQGEMTLADTGVVFFAGQADVDSQGVLHLLAVNAQAATAQPGIAANELKQSFGLIHGKLALLLDAHPTPDQKPLQPEDHNRPHGSVDALVRNLLSDDCGVAVLTSASRNEQPIDVAGHGAFAQALLEGLGGTADVDQDHTIFLSELGSFVVDRVRVLTQSRQHAMFRLPALVRSFPLAQATGAP